MSDPSKQRKWFKGQHGYDLTTEVSSDDIDNGDHQNADNCVTFERWKGHLLAQGFELSFDCGNLFLMTFILSLNDMSVFEFL